MGQDGERGDQYVLFLAAHLALALVGPEVEGDEGVAPAAPLLPGEELPGEGEVLDGDGRPVAQEVAQDPVVPVLLPGLGPPEEHPHHGEARHPGGEVGGPPGGEVEQGQGQAEQGPGGGRGQDGHRGQGGHLHHPPQATRVEDAQVARRRLTAYHHVQLITRYTFAPSLLIT